MGGGGIYSTIQSVVRMGTMWPCFQGEHVAYAWGDMWRYTQQFISKRERKCRRRQLWWKCNNPSAPGGAIGGEGEMEYIRHGGMLQQHHALATHNNLKQIMHEATGACIVFVYNRVGR